jgi:Domain of unknown function (DUF4439)
MRAQAERADRADRAGQEIRAMQAALAAEQAATYGYGVVGAHLAGIAQTTATADWTAHQVAADKLTALLRARGARLPTAAVAYQLPHQVSTAAQAAALAVELEDRVAGAYLGLVALRAESLRMLGAREVRASALRAAAWRGRTVAFPGLPASALARRPPASRRG